MGATRYAVWQRRTDEPYWPAMPTLTVDAGVMATDTMTLSSWVGRPEAGANVTVGAERIAVELPGVRGDDWLFGISACADQACSPVASAVPGGAFAPLQKADNIAADE